MRRLGWLLVPLLLLAGCGRGDTGGTAHPEPAPQFGDCARLSTPPRAAQVNAAGAPVAAPTRTAAPGGAPIAPTPLPRLTLPCYVGDAPVHVAALRGPALVNLWASWCPPCRQELPVFQRYADRAADQVHVVGVVTEDTRSASAALAEDLKLRLPTLYDRSAELRRALKRAALPITLFVDGTGQIRLLYNAEALDDDTLELLAEQYLGVVVP